MAGFEILFYEDNKLLDYHEFMSAELFDVFHEEYTVRNLMSYISNNKLGQINVRIKCYEKISYNVLPFDYDQHEFFYCKKTRTFYLIHNLRIFADVLDHSNSYDYILDQPCNILVNPSSKNFEIEIHKITIKKQFDVSNICVQLYLGCTKEIFCVETNKNSSMYDFKKEILRKHLGQMQNIRLCDIDIISHGKSINDMSYASFYTNNHVIIVINKTSRECKIDAAEVNYCANRYDTGSESASELASNILTRYVKFNYVKNNEPCFTYLLFHPNCNTNIIKQIMDVETN